MKLGQLNSAIRDSPTAPWVSVAAPTPSGQLMLHIQKTPLLAELKEHFDSRSVETGMKLLADGHLVREDYEVQAGD